jgi:imidazole glycerol-phosphate synthase subunit HisH
MIVILDYGLGNVQAIANIYARLNIEARIASAPDELRGASHLILPGVGSFDWAMTCLERSKLRDPLDEMVLEKRCPVLGICVGMQMMAHRSHEGELAGLGWINAEVKRFSNGSSGRQVQLPHMGWNDVELTTKSNLFRGLETDARFYFLHSYYFSPARENDTLSVTDYHGQFTSSVCTANIFGVQFHPEKSHSWGIRLLKNFAENDLC